MADLNLGPESSSQGVLFHPWFLFIHPLIPEKTMAPYTSTLALENPMDEGAW